MWFLFFFYLSLGIIAIIITPKRIAQYLYDKAQLVSQLRFGWLILFAVLGRHHMALVPFPSINFMCSIGVLPSHDRAYDHRDLMRLRLWHERLLHCRLRLFIRLLLGLCRPTAAV